MERDEYMRGFLSPEFFVKNITALIESGQQVVLIKNDGQIIHNVKSVSFTRGQTESKFHIKDFFEDDWWEDFNYSKFCETMSGLTGRWSEDGDEFICGTPCSKNTLEIVCDSTTIKREWFVIGDCVRSGTAIEFHKFCGENRFFMCDGYEECEPVNVIYFNTVK